MPCEPSLASPPVHPSSFSPPVPWKGLPNLSKEGHFDIMSLLNPVLLPPNVKAYLSQGERFIKWDDVSRACLPPPPPGQRELGCLGTLQNWRVGLCLPSTQAPMWLSQQSR